MGAYLSTFASSVPTLLYATLRAGQYRTPAICCNAKAVFATTAPVDAHRGAGRLQATCVVERIVAQAARDLKRDPAELRRQNVLTEVPDATPVGLTCDTGDYSAHLDKAMKLAAPCWKRRTPTSSSTTASSRSRAPARSCRSARWR